MKNINKKIILASTLIALFASCGSSGGGSGSNSNEKPTVQTNITSVKTGENNKKITHSVVLNEGDSFINDDKGSIELFDENDIDPQTKSVNTGSISQAINIGGKDAKGINKGKIVATYAMNAYDQGTVINDKGANIVTSEVKEKNSIAMSATDNSKAINRGTITSKEFFGTGMSATDGSSITNEETGEINAQNFGMSATSGEDNKEVSAENYGNIYMTEHASTGMLARGKAVAMNKKGAYIYMNGIDGSGIWAQDGATGTNYGEISMTNHENGTNAGMNATNNSHIINEEIGIISLTNGSIGMNGASNSTIENKGLITIEGKDSVGIKVNNGTAINHGKIELLGDNSIGMEAQNGGTITNEADGEIILRGTGTNLDETTNKSSLTVTNSMIGTSRTSTKIDDYTDDHKNIAFKIDKNSTFINKGKITFKNNK